jgi:hypothetical protein
VTEMLQLWNAAPETFVKRLGRYTGYCTLRQGLVGRSLSNGYGSTVPSPSLACKEMQNCTEGLQCERRVGQASAYHKPPPVPVKLLIEDVMYDLNGGRELKVSLRVFDYELPAKPRR